MRTARRLARRASRAEHRRFLAEGPQAVREALRLPGCVREVFAAPSAPPGLRDQAVAAGVPWLPVDDAALASLTDTVQPQGVVAVCEFLDDPFPALLSRGPGLLTVCADVRDPGNAGTVIRTADAAGADAVVLTDGSTDPHGGKCVRATAGSLWHLPVVSGPPVAEAVAALRTAGLVVLATSGSAAADDLDDLLDAGELHGPTAWLLGNEAAGLSEQALALADRTVRIPIRGRAESLNLSTAAAVCLYSSARASRTKSGQ